MADLREALVEAGIPHQGGYALSRNTKEFNWGAYSLTEFFFVEIPQAVGEELFWTGIGILVDKVAAKLRGSTSIPNASDAAHNAIAHILVAYPGESHDELNVVGDGVDMERKMQSIVVRSPAADYRVSLRTSPGGIVFVVASERLSRSGS